MKVIRDGIQLCHDCMIAAVNGDFTGLDYHYGSGADKRMAEIVAGLESLGPNLVSDFDGETDKGIEEFSTHPCGCCGSKLAGGRHSFAILGL